MAYLSGQMNDDMRREQLAQGLEALRVREGQPFPLAQPLHEALLGAVYPLSAEQLVRVARENEAPTVVITLLGALPREQFLSLDAVTRALSEDSGDGADLEGESTPDSHR